MRPLLDFRKGDSNTALLAFFTLLGTTAAHTLLETARDALFPERRALPVVEREVLALVVACDLDHERAERFADEHGGELAPSAEAVLAMELDVLAPCAAGGLIDDALARSIDCRVVAGAATNPLTSRAVATRVSSEWLGLGSPGR